MFLKEWEILSRSFFGLKELYKKECGMIREGGIVMDCKHCGKKITGYRVIDSVEIYVEDLAIAFLKDPQNAYKFKEFLKENEWIYYNEIDGGKSFIIKLQKNELQPNCFCDESENSLVEKVAPFKGFSLTHEYEERATEWQASEDYLKENEISFKKEE